MELLPLPSIQSDLLVQFMSIRDAADALVTNMPIRFTSPEKVPCRIDRPISYTNLKHSLAAVKGPTTMGILPYQFVLFYTLTHSRPSIFPHFIYVR